MQTIYLMSRTDRVEDAAGWAHTKKLLTREAIEWYWENLSKPRPDQLEVVVNVDFERLVVEMRLPRSLDITTYYLFAFDRRTP